MIAFLSMLLAWLNLGIAGGEGPTPHPGGSVVPGAYTPPPSPPNNQGAGMSPIYNGI